ncbi:hypothetical protein [Methanobacterium formicicum]|jgi:hypothetical protein|uniref:Uncharacterized protein n=1 Tax=Methanobacterium formicicum TaxID=2162 RepID=A0A090I2G2_METFO|nr:hypothetical protein [Methanobacterium formicicum]MDH2658896.1 hypothetical protein [Methanobacterium formicicum]CEA13044.1 hypothetical protein DSM1535_0684 [Methanobacterium formicicum]
MIGKEKLVERIEETELEKTHAGNDLWEKHIYMRDKVLIVGYEKEETYNKPNPGEEIIKNYYWYWELRDSTNWNVLFDNHDKEFSFCESNVGGYTDQDRVEDLVGDIEEEDVCTWSEQDWIEDISEDIAEETIDWLKSLEK